MPDGLIPHRAELYRATACRAAVCPGPRRRVSRPRSATGSAERGRTSYTPSLHECLDGASDALCTSPPRLRHYHPFATAAISPRPRLTGTTGARLRCPGPARPRWRTRWVRRSTEFRHRTQGADSGHWGRCRHGPCTTLKRHFALRFKLARLCTAETYPEPQRTRETPALSMSHGKAKPKAKNLR